MGALETKKTQIVMKLKISNLKTQIDNQGDVLWTAFCNSCNVYILEEPGFRIILEVK